MLKTNVLCIFVTASLLVATEQQKVGESCSIEEKNNAPGECKVLKDCAEALEALKEQRFPQLCGFQGTVPIVCCSKITETPSRGNRRPGELSIEKCKEYEQIIKEEIVIPTFDIDENPTVTESQCTHEIATLVIGGVDASPKEFPHMALLGYQLGNGPRKWLCGGSLISDLFVLTAGHCITSPGNGQVRFVRVGDLDISTTNDDAQPQDFIVVQRIKHPNYKLPSKYNDIALLKINRPVEFSLYARPACLYTGAKPLRSDQKFIATGWGLTEVGSNTGANILQKVILDAFSHSECNSSYESNINRKLKNGILPDSQLCAGGKTEEKDTCQGDSGGPLQIYSDLSCMYDIVGVTSFGKSCGLVAVPGVYTRVSNYLEWIENTVWS